MSAGSPRRDRWSSGDSGWLVGIAGGLAVLLAAVAIQPLLRGGWWLPMTALVVALMVTVGAATRGLRAPAPVQPLVQAAALVGALLVGFTTAQPEVGRIEQLRMLAAQGREYAEMTPAPAGPDLGLLLLLVGGLGLAAIAVDTLAADVDLPGLALVPLAAIFAVPWAINDLSAPWWAFVVVGVAWLVVLAATQHHRLRAWSEHAGSGSLTVGLLAAVATLGAAVLGGAAAAAREPFSALDLSWGRGGSLRVDTLVSLRRSLVGTDDRIVLRYTTTHASPDYFRTAALEQFDGVQWSDSNAGFLAETPPTGTEAGALQLGDQPEQYALDIGPLAGSIVPSPWGTIASPNSWPALWDQRTAVLERTDGNPVTGTRAILVALPRDADAAEMRQASVVLLPGELGSTDDQVLPESPGGAQDLYPEMVVELAQEVTAQAGTPYDRALALQRWFTTGGGFTYSTEVEGGSGDDALVSFLTERVGYCEQYAAAMAVMARALGIPSRVAVGFTQGTQQDDESWIVRASDAHAWPELWMGAAGWVRFEPTPGAATTRTPAYTLDQAGGGSAPVLPSAASPGASAADPDRVSGAEDEDALGGEAISTRQAPLWAWLVVLVLGLLAVPGVVRAVRRARRLRGEDPESAYAEVLDTALDLGMADLGATPRAALAVVGRRLGAGAPELSGRPAGAGWRDGPARPDPIAVRLAELRDGVERARYGPVAEGGGGGGGGGRADGRPGVGSGPGAGGAPAPGSGTRTEAGTAVLESSPDEAAPGWSGHAREICEALRGTAGRGARWRALLLPRSVLAGWAARIGGGGEPTPSAVDQRDHG